MLVHQHMPRKARVLTSDHPYHLSARSNNRDWFDLPLADCFDVFSSVLPVVCERYELKVHAFVLMSNHWHMLATTPRKNVDQAMMYFMSQTSRGLRKKTNRINHIYGGRYRATVIQSEHYYATCYRYVAQNPLVAEIVDRVEDYPFSTFSKAPNPLSNICIENSTGHASLLPTCSQEKMKWLNEILESKVRERMRIGLKRPIFQ